MFFFTTLYLEFTPQMDQNQVLQSFVARHFYDLVDVSIRILTACTPLSVSSLSHQGPAGAAAEPVHSTHVDEKATPRHASTIQRAPQLMPRPVSSMDAS